MAEAGLVVVRRAASSWTTATYAVTPSGRRYALDGIEFKHRWGYGQPVNE